MSSTPRKLTILAVGVVMLFAIGLTHLFLLRFKAGDVYPAYSSLRTDPLGARALFDSLNQVTRDSARRNFQTPDQIPMAGDTTVLICGLSAESSFLGRKKVGELVDRVAISGGRLVLTFTTHRPPREETEADGEAAGQSAEDGNCSEPCESRDGDDDAAGQSGEDDTEYEWLGAASMGFDFKRPTGKKLDDTAFRVTAGAGVLPPAIPWRAPLSFELVDDAWETLYTWQGDPVVVQRPWGKGTVVMMADSYLFSNEALRNHRLTGFLAWVLVPGHLAIFDEFHHGLVRQPGISGLARRYRLHGVFGALLVVAALLIWRQTAVFVRPAGSGNGSSTYPAASGRDTAQGLVNLVREHISDRELLTVCCEAWLPHTTQRVPETLVARVQSLVRQAAAAPGGHDPVALYRSICELLQQGRKK